MLKWVLFVQERRKKQGRDENFHSFILRFSFFCLTFAPAKEKHRGVEQLVARQAHNLEVARSSRAPATRVVAGPVAFVLRASFFVAPPETPGQPEGNGASADTAWLVGQHNVVS